jgi:hypothetical protein
MIVFRIYRNRKPGAVKEIQLVELRKKIVGALEEISQEGHQIGVADMTNDYVHVSTPVEDFLHTMIEYVEQNLDTKLRYTFSMEKITDIVTDTVKEAFVLSCRDLKQELAKVVTKL